MYRETHCGDEMVVRSSYLYRYLFDVKKMDLSLTWNGDQCVDHYIYMIEIMTFQWM